MISDPLSGANRLFSFIGLPFTSDVRNFLANHTALDSSDPIVAKVSHGYYGIRRGSDFEPDSWKITMTEESIQEIEDKCHSYMHNLGYEKFAKLEGHSFER